MLSKIICPLFSHDEIIFHQGLNVILGDDDAKNSIGKSSALMAIDFSMGGSSLLEDKAGVIKALGHHTYSFEFIFNGQKYFFKRSTNESSVVHECNEDYKSEKEISIDEYTEKLKNLYGLQELNSSFRSLVSPFVRIWNKGALDPDHPFSADAKEPYGSAIGRIIDIFSRARDIEEEKSVLDAHNEKKKLISKSMSAEIIPKINKTQYKENQKKISDNTEAIDALKKGFSGALSAYEALFDETLRELQHRKIDLISQRNEVQAKIDRIRRDLLGVTPRLTANIALIQEFFPNVDADRLEKVEAFHQNISRMVQKELRRDLSTHSQTLSEINANISSIDNEIGVSLAAKGTPDDLFSRVFDLKEITDKASTENRFYDQKVAIEKEAALSKERLEVIYTTIFLDIESSLNSKLKRFNNVVYGASRNASQLRIKNSTSYSFISSDDTGTGKSYAGLVGFDLAILALTPLPFLVHDSVIYKNIEVPATRNILRILASVKRKQIFIAFDEAVKFGAVVEKLLHNHAVIKLSDKDLLYKKDWREQ